MMSRRRMALLVGVMTLACAANSLAQNYPAKPILLVTHPALPVKSVKEFIALMKARPGQFNYASAGPGSPQSVR